MKKQFIFIVLAFSVSACSTMQTAKINTSDKISCNDTGISFLERETLGQRGCCSWHGGVCGCQGGSVVCCDGSYSPSCSCRADGVIQ